MIIREVRACGYNTEVDLEYVGERMRTITLTQDDLKEFGESSYHDFSKYIANYIKNKFGTDY